MLKADLHMHTDTDKTDKLHYSARQLIDHAASLKLDVISITHHDELWWDKKMVAYAEKKGILLIPGAELTLDGKHVLVLNITEEDIANVKTLVDLPKLRREETLVVAPHPFFRMGSCLGKKLLSNISSFDAIEYSHFYTRFINPNKMAVKVSRRYRKPMLGSSDSHLLVDMGTTYTYIDARKDPRDIILAIKKGNIRIVTRPLSLSYFLRKALFLFTRIRLGFDIPKSL